MPGPPTPLSGCPIRRLVIHNEQASKVYDSTRPTHALSLTIEGQRTMGSNKTLLVLLVHCGAQRMLSIKLDHLLDQPCATSDAITIDKESQRLRIRVREQNHTILADFQESRDFNVAICMLKKSGFEVKNHEVTATPPFPTSTFGSTGSLGPHLSSITHLPGADASFDFRTQQDVSFTSLYEGEGRFPPTSETQGNPMIQTPSSLYPGWSGSPAADGFGAQPSSSSQLTAYVPHLNPYNALLGKQTHESYRPLVSSPLRHSVQPWEPRRQLSNPDFGLHAQPSLLPTSPVRRATFNTTYPSVTQPDTRRKPNNGQVIPHNSMSIMEDDIADGSPSSGDALDIIQKQSAQDFRELLPQRRSLPFVQNSENQGREKSPRILHSEDPGSTGSAPSRLPTTDSRSNRRKSQRIPESEDPTPTETDGPLSIPLTEGSRSNKRNSAEFQSPSASSRTRTQRNNQGTHVPRTQKSGSTTSRTKPTTRNKIQSNEVSIENSSISKPQVVLSNPRNSRPTTRAKIGKSVPPKQTKPRRTPSSEANSPPKRQTRSTAVSKRQRNGSDSPKAQSRSIVTRRQRKLQEAEPTPESTDAECQVSPATSVPRQPCATVPTRTRCSELTKPEPSPILVTNSVLRQVNEATSKILDQYEADVKGGSDAEASAQFYLDQLMTTRQEFWHAKLLGLESELLVS